MAIHKEILEWQAAHPNTTWLAWGITWLVILSALLMAIMLTGVWALGVSATQCMAYAIHPGAGRSLMNQRSQGYPGGKPVRV